MIKGNDEKRFRGLKAIYVNCSLKMDPKESHTGRLMSASATLMSKNGVAVDHVHIASEQIAPGIYPDMTKHGWEKDQWPTLWERVKQADILVIGTPIWLGEESSLCRILIERLYAMSDILNDKGQSIYYGKVGGAVITGNEDGIKHCAMSILYAMQHLGYLIPPQADCGWIGEAGPGLSYADSQDDGSRVGYDNEFTQRNTTIMSWNLMHLAKMLQDAQGISAQGNDRKAWKAGNHFGFENPQ